MILSSWKWLRKRKKTGESNLGNADEEYDCDICWDTGKLGICTCAAHPDSVPCGGCTEPWRPDEDWRDCFECGGERPCDCPSDVIFAAGCQRKLHY